MAEYGGKCVLSQSDNWVGLGPDNFMKLGFPAFTSTPS